MCHNTRISNLRDLYTTEVASVFIKKFILFKIWYRYHNKYPSAYSNDTQEKKLAKWCITQRYFMRKGILPFIKIRLLDTLVPYWKWNMDVKTKKEEVIIAMRNISTKCHSIQKPFEKLKEKIDIVEGLMMMNETNKYDENMMIANALVLMDGNN